MCHVHRISYSCSHGDLVLHSKCRATRIKLARKKSINLPYEEGYSWTPVYPNADALYYQVAACKAHSTLEIKLKTKCGPCRFDAVKTKWDQKMAKTRAGASMMEFRGAALDELSEELREERAKEEWGCRRMYPPEGKKGPITKLRLRIRNDRGESPLRNELQPKDIEDVEEVDWNKMISDFDKPIPEKDFDGGTFMDFFEDRYGFWGPDFDFAEPHVDSSSLQILDLGTKDESLIDSGYSSAEAGESDEETRKRGFWDFAPSDVPIFPPDEGEEHDDAG